MNIWVYLTGNIITAVTMIVTLAFAMGRLSQILTTLSEQVRQSQVDLEKHQQQDQMEFDQVNKSLLAIAMHLHPSSDTGKENF